MKLLLTLFFIAASLASFAQTVPVATQTTLDGSTSNDDDGTIASYSWKQISGPATPAITSPTSVKTTVTGFSVPGVYRYELKVTDNQGAVSIATTDVTVYAANRPPNARITVSPNAFQLPK